MRPPPSILQRLYSAVSAPSRPHSRAFTRGVVRTACTSGRQLSHNYVVLLTLLETWVCIYITAASLRKTPGSRGWRRSCGSGRKEFSSCPQSRSQVLSHQTHSSGRNPNRLMTEDLGAEHSSQERGLQSLRTWRLDPCPVPLIGLPGVWEQSQPHFRCGTHLRHGFQLCWHQNLGRKREKTVTVLVSLRVSLQPPVPDSTAVLSPCTPSSRPLHRRLCVRRAEPQGCCRPNGNQLWTWGGFRALCCRTGEREVTGPCVTAGAAATGGAPFGRRTP